MTIGEKQREFTQHIALLILFAYSRGYQLTFGEALRTKEQAALNAASGAGISNSLHLDKLAVDLSLFKDGTYLTDSAYYTFLGVFWKALHPENAWGGDFKDKDGKPKPDGNHFSRSHEGRK
jgi:hypothetical protein